jgi:predicted small integral membrane protein
VTLRFAKASLVSGVTLFCFFVVFNNLNDYNSNFQLVRHILMMDSTFPGNNGMWRAINQPAVHTLFYIIIILWEILTLVLCAWGSVRLFRALRGSTLAFRQASNLAIAGLTLSLLMWLVAFLSVGGEWFLMWQSKSWNGQEAAFRMFTVIGIVLLVLLQPDSADRS